jgi:hypothetical protein
MGETRKIAAILVADVVDYSRLAGADEDRTLARVRALRFRARHDRTGNLPLLPVSSPARWHRSFAPARTASASLSWRAGECRARLSTARP